MKKLFNKKSTKTWIVVLIMLIVAIVSEQAQNHLKILYEIS